MNLRRLSSLMVYALCLLIAQTGLSDEDKSLAAQREALFKQLQSVHRLTDDQLGEVRAIFAGSAMMGSGNPAVTQHPATPQECAAKLAAQGVTYENPAFEKICGGKYMAPLYDPAKQKPEQATQCIDQFEFPDIPCAYPVIWVKAKEAAELCEAVGKRLCDAHEWESGCAGQLIEPDYRFDLARGGPNGGIQAMRSANNRKWADSKSWSYGLKFQRGVCGQSSHKSPDCNGGNWARCGSNTFPAGYWPACHSTLGVYDINGNAAEHMNLPLNESQMASRGSKTLGYTEMKGSWFIWDQYQAHEDWCRWRAPYWHGTRVMAEDSHSNYHLGFRCCKTLAK